MDPKNSRKARREQEEIHDRRRDGNEVNKAYYIVIGILVLILVGLVVFLFTREDDNINLENAEESALVDNDSEMTEEAAEDNSDVTDEEASENEATSSDEDSEESDTVENTNEDEEIDEEENDDSADDADAEVGETVVVNEDAPYDPSYEVNYNEGSPDLAAIVDEARAATGLETFTQWFIAYEGPAQVVATVVNTSQSEYYDVYLQYGDGNWHVTSYERLANNPF